jgi:uncharacterized protein (TIGR02271 family)
MANPTTNAPESLVCMSDADYEVAPGEPDVRGWDVVLANDQAIGEVEDLIIDPSAGKVRYLDVELDRKTLELERDRHVLIPISSAGIDAKDEQIVVNGLDRTALLRLPEYDRKTYASGYDHTYRSHVSEDARTKRLTRSAEELRIGKRAEQKGEVRVSKHVETERVRQSVPLQREEVRVERRPVEHAVGSAADMRNEEIRVPVREEEAVIEKRPVVKEEVIVSKEPRTTERTVEADLRHEEVDVNPSSSNVLFKDDVKERGGK